MPRRLNIDKVIEWLVKTANEVEYGKVAVIISIVDNEIELIRKIDERTEKYSNKKKPVLPSE
jgi:hypothetical protein